MNTTGKAEGSGQSGDSLEEFEQRFEQWRGKRKQGERIPVAMWAAVVMEARARSVYRVARALRLDCALLKLRGPPPGNARGAAPGNQPPGAGRLEGAVQCLVERVMIQITPHMRILVVVERVDFRCGIDGLVAVCSSRHPRANSAVG